jgi:hypothetical protein
MNIPTPSPSNHPPTEARVRRACLADVPAVRALGTEFYRRVKDPNGTLDEAQRAYLDGALARMWGEDYLRHIRSFTDRDRSIAQIGFRRRPGAG